MSRQAQVGAFALLALLLLFGVFYTITDWGTRHTGYRIGVHFDSAAGLHSGALVFFSGVNVGTVDSIILLPDNTVDVVLAINRDVDVPSASRIIIQAPLTGDPSVLIVPPLARPGEQLPMLAREVLPVDQQARGINTATVADLLQQGQGEIVKLDQMLSQLAQREPKLLDTLQSALSNANDVTVTLKDTLGSLHSSLAVATANIVALTGTLNDTTQLNASKITDMLTQFDAASRALNDSMGQLEGLAKDKDLKANILATTKNIADTTANIADLTHDLRSMTGDPNVQAQLKNTVANLDATMQRASSLLGTLGGTSSVCGVDQNAPCIVASPLPGAAPAPGVAQPMPSGSPLPVTPLRLQHRLAGIASSLIQIQLRVGELSSSQIASPNGLLSADRGPQTDLNAVFLPKSTNSLMVGANDIGYHTTANLALLHSIGSGFRVGGGILYSQLGFLTKYDTNLFGAQASIYDPRRPELDLFGNVHLTKNLELFAGERAINHPERRFNYGLQTNFP
jgi:phospholipid/cholesterol/gamma-HCH transport system substrate-binding protein